MEDDGGQSWTPLADLIANIAVSALAMDPKNPNVIYAGTGEGYFNVDLVRGAGIFKTTDGGATWTRLASTNVEDFYFVNDIVISPSNSQRIYAATRSGVFHPQYNGASNPHAPRCHPRPHSVIAVLLLWQYYSRHNFSPEVKTNADDHT